MLEPSPAGVIVLAGGEATRLPGKLTMRIGDFPLLVRVFRNVSAGRETMISCNGALPFETGALIDAPVVVDRWPLRGPLSGLLSTMSALRTPWVFAVAGDAPFIDAGLIAALEACIEPGAEAIVPRHNRDGETRIEPLAALYARDAFLREGMQLLMSGSGSLHAVVERLQTRYLDLADGRIFANVNTKADYDALAQVLA